MDYKVGVTRVKHGIVLFLVVIFLLPAATNAEDVASYRVEGHGFSAATLKPLPGVKVELWGFYANSPNFRTTVITNTDEGGFYRIEDRYQFTDQNGNDEATGYAFAFVCHYNDTYSFRIMPLYSSLKPGEVYHRNFYMQVPESVTKCDGFNDI